MISKILEIFGRAVNIDTPQIIWHWIEATINKDRGFADASMDEILDLVCNLKLHLADEKIQNYKEANPGSVIAEMAEAMLCLKRNKVQQTIAHLNYIYQHQPNNTMALYVLGHCYERLGKDDLAVRYYQDCVKFKGYLQLPLQRLGAIYFRNGRLTDAINQYRQLCHEYPDDTESYIILGYLYIANQEYQHAIDAFNNAITMHPDNFQNNSEFAEIDELIKNSNLEGAIEAMKSMFEQLGELPELYIKLSDLHYYAGNFLDAINCLKKASKLQSNNLQAAIKLGTLYMKENYISQAAEQFNIALELNDEIVDAYIGLATGQYLVRQTNDCRDTISLASAVQQNSTLLYGQAVCLKNKACLNTEVSIEKMILEHQKNIGKNPEDPDAYYKAGLILLAAGDIKQACDKFETTLQLNPYHFRAKSKLVICSFEMGKPERAFEILNENDGLDSEIINLHYKTAVLYCDQYKFDGAMDRLNENMKQCFAHTDPINNIAVVLANIGVIDRASVNLVKLSQV